MPDLAALLSPRTIAVIGASPDVNIIRGRTLKVMLRHAYAGRIYPVSRSHDTVQGLQAYRSVAEIPGRVDLALMVIPAEFIPEELERCGKAGVRAALILTSGFAEQRGGAGEELQRQIHAIAQRYDLAVCGPNAEGFASMGAALCATFSPAVDELAVPLVPEWRRDGHVAVIAQSGGMGFAFFDRARPKNIPFSYVVTTGNEACLESFDIVDYLLDEGRTEVFLMFLENIRNPHTFTRVAEKALKAGKPIIVAKIGQSEAGNRAAASHTAALAGAYEAYQAMFHRYGIIEGADLEEMVDIAAGFSVYRDRPPAGPRVGIFTASGGGGGWIADACVKAGLQVPELDAESRARIDPHLPPYGTSQNPVDGTAQAIRELGYGEMARLVSLSDNVDSVVVVTTARSVENYEREKDKLFNVARDTRKPILMWSYTLPIPASVELLSRAGYPLYTNMRNCARTVAAMAQYRALRERELHTPAVRGATDEQRRERVRGQLAKSGPVICEFEAAGLLAEYGIAFAKSRLVSNAEEAVAAASALATPVALKVQSPNIPHKTEAGAVALRVEGAETVRRAYQDVLANAHRNKPEADIRGVLVQAMAAPGVEMILGIQSDEVFGPMLLVGFGGIHVETLRDVALAPVPVSAAYAHELLDQLRGRRLLDGVRGNPPADIEELIHAMVALSGFAADHADSIATIDLNPAIVHAQGDGVTVVDALIVKR